jgi:hypothetical protein
MPKRVGRKSAAQTPAPKSEKIYGSNINPKDSAASKTSGEKIVLSEEIVTALKNKMSEHNKEYPSKKVTLAALKAVYRRGAGAYSSSHRPTITGGVPNTRNAWAIARVNKFLQKKAGKEVKRAYIQDDDLLENGGKVELLAPNGQPSNLTPEQYKLVRTPEFKAWFGDWENEPENASKVVDDNGEPMVVWHGTYVKEHFNSFDFNKADLGFHFGTYQQAKERSETKIVVSGYKSIVKPYFLNIKELFNVTDVGEWEYPQRYLDMFISDNLITEKDAKRLDFFSAYTREDNKKIRDYLIKKYDGKIGFIYSNKIESKGNSFIALTEKQMKLADGTNTTFDANNPNIRFKKGGSTLLAPNGKPSNLTPEQYKLVRTPEFKAWFGDWEKAYETGNYDNVSKVIDNETKEPLVVYHGSPNIFNVFNSFNEIHFIDYSDYTTGFGKYIYVCFLNIKNPFFVKKNYEEIPKGYDGTIFNNFFKSKY